MQPAKTITRDAIMPLNEYAKQRQQLRHAIIKLKSTRRIAVGPYATFYFENYATMHQQIQEMLYIEKGGDAQLDDELAAYNPMIPQGRELTATLMFEINDAVLRARILASLTHVEHCAFIELGAHRIAAVAEQDVERTKADGKTSSVHFLHFPFTDSVIAAFKHGSEAITLGIEHAQYAHMTILSKINRRALADDFD